MESQTSAEQYLFAMARKYVWWKEPAGALAQPYRVAAQVMNIGGFDDARLLVERLGEPYLSAVLEHAEPGWFNARSWHYWHYRLNVATLDNMPPLPRRLIA